MSETTKPTVNVSSLKNMLVATKSTEVEYPGMPGFKVKVDFLSREVLNKLRKKSTNTSLKKGALVESLNDDLFLQLYVSAAIKGWTGLTMKFLSQLAPVELDGISEDAELEFSDENALYLMKNSTSFDSWITETVSDLGNFPTSKGK